MKKKILLQIDHDELASSFDSIVAIDAGVDCLLRYTSVTPIQIVPLVHGAIFTRGAKDLHQTAFFFGGSNVSLADDLFEHAKRTFMGPLQVSLMVDPNGSNTTSAAAVRCATRHVDLRNSCVSVLAGTGPVGQRIAQLAAHEGAAHVQIASRDRARAKAVCDRLQSAESSTVQFVPLEVAAPAAAIDVAKSSKAVFAAGAAGVALMDGRWLKSPTDIRVAIDVNAVPPAGIAGIEPTDAGRIRGDAICYGAIGVGALKMKIHKRAIQRLFETNDAILSTKEIYSLSRELSDP
jgi:hypothetical protein